MRVLFGSQTGNSEDIAERISKRLRILGYRNSCTNLEEYSASHLIEEEFVVFVCSTTGQGEFPDSMKQFWRFLLRKNLPANSLTNLLFCVIALGDSSYEKYNVAGKKLHKRIKQLGAQEFLPIALFDDQHELGYDAEFETWSQRFFEKLSQSFAPTLSDVLEDDALLPPKYNVCFIKQHIYSNVIVEKQTLSSNNGRNCTEVIANDRVTSGDHFQAVHHIRFRLDGNISYNPGDVIEFMPENFMENVEEFLELFKGSIDDEFVLKPVDPDMPLPKHLPIPCTLRNCATSFWDIQGIPRRSVFDILWHFSQCDIEKEKLKEFTSVDGKEELYSYVNRPRRNILEVLQDFPNTTPYVPLDYFFDLIPCIRPRSFSIASSLKSCPNEVHVLVAVVKYKTRLKKPRQGLCSTWLSRLDIGTKIPFVLKPGSIALPQADTPVIMIGPGTGCAPFVGFVQERVAKGIKSNYMFFGCRYKSKDFFFETEWMSLVSKGMLTLFTAFSRDQEKKIYVQDKMLEQSALIWDMIHNCHANIYIAGNSKSMPTDVKKCLTDIVNQEGNKDLTSSELYIKNLETKRKLFTETWS